MTARHPYVGRLRREWLIGSILSGIMVIFLSFFGLLRPAGDLLFDSALRIQGFKPNEQIVIVAIDDRSIARLGGWPLDRAVYAELLDKLAEPAYKPRVIGVNLLFLDQTPADHILADAMKQHQMVLPVGFGFAANGELKAAKPVEPIEKVSHLAHINAVFERDGSVRGIRESDNGYLQFSLLMHQIASKDTPFNASQQTSDIKRVHMMDPGQPYLTVSLSDAIDPIYPRERFKDKYVLIGVTSASLGDRFSTLYSGAYNSNTPGVAVLASALQSSIERKFYHTGSFISTVAYNLVGLWMVLISLLYLAPMRSLIWSLGLLTVWIAISGGVLWKTGLWLDPTPLIFTVMIFQPLWAWRRVSTMARVINRGASDLQRALPRVAGEKKQRREEYVVEHAMLLDKTVEAVSGELDFLSSVLEQLPDALAIYSSDRRLLLWNSLFARLWTGQDLEQGLGAVVLMPWFGISEDLLFKEQSTLLNLVQQAEHGDKSIQVMLKVNQHHSERLGQVWILVLSDISELRRLESQRDRALQFLSHDMRTPVSSIMMINKEGETPNPKIAQHAKSLLQMMDDFCMLMMADEPKYQMQTELLENFIDDAIQHVRDIADFKSIDIQYSEPEEPVFVNANARLLVRALTNLLQNAVKFSPSRSVILVLVEVMSKKVAIDIINPVGMKKSEEKILPGFGLGMHFVETVVAKHHANLMLQIPHEGMAKVTLELPIVREQ